MLMYFFECFILISPCVWPNSGFWCCVFLTLRIITLLSLLHFSKRSMSQRKCCWRSHSEVSDSKEHAKETAYIEDQIFIYIYILVWTLCLMHRCVFGPFGLILISDPLGAGHAFPRQWHIHRGGVIYFCQGFLLCMMPSMNGWRDGWTGHVIKKASRKKTTTFRKNVYLALHSGTFQSFRFFFLYRPIKEAH
jgi:hypothetical protein